MAEKFVGEAALDALTTHIKPYIVNIDEQIGDKISSSMVYNCTLYKNRLCIITFNNCTCVRLAVNGNAGNALSGFTVINGNTIYKYSLTKAITNGSISYDISPSVYTIENPSAITAAEVNAKFT